MLRHSHKMARHSYKMAALRLTRVTALFLALIVPARSRVVRLEPEQFEAAFQGRCGVGSPCEQLCRELHDGTFECGCGPGFILHEDGYGCMQLNSTKVNSTSILDEDVIYQKDVSFTAELEIAPQTNVKIQHKQKHIITTLPTYISNVINQNKPNNERKMDFIATGERSKLNEGIANLIEDGLSREEVELIDDRKDNGDDVVVTTLGPNLELKLPNTTLPPPWTPAVERCNCKCGDDDTTCPCPHTLAWCLKDTSTITVPRFSGSSWLALRTLHGAYKRVRIRLRVRPERAKGILLLTGENDDLSGDYLALVLRDGHVELRFECGSGAGVLRTWEPVRLGRWNTITVYRHRWDAWLRLNQGKRVMGRSKGLFSRMTFRQPVWLGGGGNASGLDTKLGLTDGLLGCVDYLTINGQTYNLIEDSIASYGIGECAPTLAPWKPDELTALRNNDAITKTEYSPHHIYNINDIVNFEDNDIVMRDAKATKTKTELNNSVEQFKKDKIDNFVLKHNDKQEILLKSKRKENSELIASRISVKSNVIDDIKSDDKCECQHGGGCVSGVCLCPLGYAGVRCEITLDLKVPRFNGSSYLRLPGLGNSAESWLNIQITLKASDGDGVVLLNSERSDRDEDMFALLLRGYYVEFVFDLGSGSTVVRSASPLERDKWHRVTVNRAGRKATLTVYDIESQSTSISETRSVQSHGGARRLSLHGALYLGGYAVYPSRLRLRKSLSGCVKQLIINDEEISVVAAALGGVNVDNCDDSASFFYPCSDKKSCSEKVYLSPQHTQNYSLIDPHQSIVPKKGILPKHKKNKTKNNRHEKTKKYKNLAKNTDYTIVTQKPIKIPLIERSPFFDYESYKPVEVVSDFEDPFLPVEEETEIEYDKSKYLDSNDINWSDLNTYPSFSGRDSYVHIDDEETIKRLRSPHVEINIRFRSTHHSGLLVWSGGHEGDFLALALIDSVLVFSYNLGNGEVVIVANHTRVDDGLWHRARATRNGQAGVLEVDGQGSVGKISPGTLTQLNTENGLYIGGLPSIEVTTGSRYHSGLIGCVSQISLGGDLEIPLSSLQHMISSNVARCST